MFMHLPTTRWSRRSARSHLTPESGSQPSDATIRSPATYRDGLSRTLSVLGLPASGRTALYAVTLTAAGLSGCASLPPPPTPQMTRAEVAIEQAQRDGAADLATEPLLAAQRKLAEAKVAVSQRDNARATDLVQEADADARLADLTARSRTSARAAAEVDTSIQTLENETTRANQR